MLLVIGRWLACLSLVAAFAQAVAAEDASHVVIGWDSSDGHVLLGELGCIACHAPREALTSLPVKQAPILGDVGARVRPQYLRDLLRNPQHAKPGTPMPDLLAKLPEKEREATINALVHYLTSLGGPAELAKESPQGGDRAQGELLYHTVGCVACHQPFAAAPKHKIDPSTIVDEAEAAPVENAELRPSIPLPNLAHKTNISTLAKFLENPLAARPSGRMPSLGLSATETRAIATYLIEREEAAPAEAFKLDGKLVAEGRAAFASLGCASCHSTSRPTAPERMDLAAIGAKVQGYAPRGNRSPPNETPANAIDGKTQTKYLNFSGRNSGLLIELPQPVIVSALALTSANDAPDRDPADFLLEGSRDGRTFVKIAGGAIPNFGERFQRQRLTFELGTEAFSIYRLTFPKLANSQSDAMQVAEVELYSYQPPGERVASTLQAKPLADLKAVENGCLAAEPVAGRPHYALSAKQRAALVAAMQELKQRQGPWPAAREVHHLMTAMNCYACHARGEQGGPEFARNGYFTYEKLVELGDEGRLPPPIHEVGAKLTDAGFADMLFDGVRYRTYMATRMPQFGKQNLAHLPALLSAADHGKIPEHTPKFDPKFVSEGRKLTGKNTFACINCHAWSGARLPGAEGLDLLQTTRRLRPEWFHAWLLDPQSIRPRTRMPTAWPEGKSTLDKVLGGDAHAQIDAIWAYLSAGERGGPPPGLSILDQEMLRPYDEPLVFRTFLDQVSAHALLIGHKEGTHAAFDANRVRLVLAWQGDFVSPSAAWEGRAGQYSRLPTREVFTLPEGPPLAKLASESDKWPEDVPKPRGGVDSSRTPEGWEWRGYKYDGDRRIVLMYRAGEIDVEETVGSEYRQVGGVLLRKFVLRSKDAVPDLYLFAASGKQIERANATFRVDDKVDVLVTERLRPVARASGERQELIVPVEWTKSPAGVTAEITLQYAW
jgi:cytochrome c551/c552